MSDTAPIRDADTFVVGRSRWTNILPIVFVMYTIAYFDRANIGIALPFISKDLGLTALREGSSLACSPGATRLRSCSLAI